MRSIGRVAASAAILVICLGLLFPDVTTYAQTEVQVQELVGRVDAGDVNLYLLPDLKAGERLYVRVQGRSGNLDPVAGLTDGATDPLALVADFETSLAEAVASGRNVLEEIERLRNEYTLVWDDDSGGGLAAAFELEIPDDGDYRLLVAGALSTVGGSTFGDYQLLVGLNEPLVLTGEAEPNGAVIAFEDLEATPQRFGVQEITGSFSDQKTSTFFELNEFAQGETFYAFIEATSGDLTPTLELTNFAGKPIRSANLAGSETSASLQYTFPLMAEGFRIEIGSHGIGKPLATGEYRLLLGANAEEVLSGQAAEDGREIAKQPIDVKIGVQLEQIVDVDQQLEFFTGAASLRMEWNDPAWAFNPEECQCEFKAFEGGAISSFVTSEGRRWPEFTIRNQQGNRWRQNDVLVVFSNGDAAYFERFTTNFQVDFDFEQFPFDTQTFVIRVDSLFPDEFYTFSNNESYSVISPENGEDEFILSDAQVEISSTPNSGGNLASRYTFSFEGPRHLSYYVFQIFVPILLIILVSWFTFFLKDYVSRIEDASGNLLLFIAFSFSLSDNYPRLGYLTFLDAVMAIMFVVNALVVIYNVSLRRMEMNERGELVERIDSVMDWVYPLLYIGLLIILIWWFF